MKGKLYLFPNTIGGEGGGGDRIIQELIPHISIWIVENQKAFFRFQHVQGTPIQGEVWILRESDPEFIYQVMKEIEEGKNVGMLSESGLVGVADPGTHLISAAHVRNIPVIPLPGPSSITLALAASGLPGQRFAFWGYLPTKEKKLYTFVRKLEKLSQSEAMTQIVMETPYRTPAALKSLLKTLSPNTLLVVAQNLGGLSPQIHRKFVSEWREEDEEKPLPQLPTLFLFYSNPT